MGVYYFACASSKIMKTDEGLSPVMACSVLFVTNAFNSIMAMAQIHFLDDLVEKTIYC